MISLAALKIALASEPIHQIEYQCLANLNLYNSPERQELATQAASDRHLQILSLKTNPAATDDISLQVRLLEDGYICWLAAADLQYLVPATNPYHPPVLTAAEIQRRLPEIIAFTQAAMAQPNYYLWGGTVAPNYDCSGLMQAAFAASGIWLPRNSYQQADFVQPIAFEELQPGDLVFFAKVERISHVGLYLGEKRYIHSSGKDMGRNGIGIDCLSPDAGEISRIYYQQLKSAGRVVASYQPESQFV